MDKRFSDARLLVEEKQRLDSSDAYFKMCEQHAKEIRVLNDKVICLIS